MHHYTVNVKQKLQIHKPLALSSVYLWDNNAAIINTRKYLIYLPDIVCVKIMFQ